MQKLYRKRVWRNLKANSFRYLALGMLIVLGIYLIVSLVGAAETVIIGVNEKALENKIEDGEFSVFVPFTDDQEQELIKKGISLERMFYLDFSQADDSTLRIYKNREILNLIDLDEGTIAAKNNEAVLERRYCEEHDLSIGDTIEIGRTTFKIVGIGTVPDYDAMLKNFSDSSVDSGQFGLAFVYQTEYDYLKENGDCDKSEQYVYAYQLNGMMTNEELKELLQEIQISQDDVEDEYFQEYWKEVTGEKEGVTAYTDGVSKTVDGSSELSEGLNELKGSTDEFLDTYFDIKLSNLTIFLTASDNPRIRASIDDQTINKLTGLIAGIIVMVLLTYVISVFVIHEIEQESSVIGALYALGVKKKDLMIHYLMLPVCITFASSIVGTIIGFSKWGISNQIKDTYAYYSLPLLQILHPAYLIIYALVMPTIVTILVNCIVIQKRLSLPALKLIRNEQKASKISNINLGNLGFISRFRIRQMLREIRVGASVIFAMFISLLIMMIGIDCYVMCQHISVENKEDTKYEYMYTYKYPEETVPAGGEACFLKTLKKEIYSHHLDISLLGIDPDNPYFDTDITIGKSKVVISSAMAQKYQLSIGDELILSDEEEEIDYAFQITGITQYSVGLYAFMDIDSMRELFGEKEDYYNVVLADHELDIDSGRLYAITTKQDISKSSDVFISMMIPMVSMMIVVSFIIFCVVLYLMIRVMIDRSSFNISLIKIFGYRNGEIRKLYLNGNFYIIAFGAAFCIPLAKWVIDSIYPLFVSNVSCSINLSFSWQLYLGIYLIILLIYFAINQILAGRLKKMIPAEVLKNRE